MTGGSNVAKVDLEDREESWDSYQRERERGDCGLLLCSAPTANRQEEGGTKRHKGEGGMSQARQEKLGWGGDDGNDF